MLYNYLGNTNIFVSKLSFGTWAIGGSANKSPAYGIFEIQESKNIISKAIDKGINFFDTAPAYGNGRAEKILGNFNKVKDIIVCTKIGRTNLTDSFFWDVDDLLRSVHSSLRRLKRNYLDILLLHSPPIESLEKLHSAYSFLNAIKDKGLIRQFGISLSNPSDWEYLKGLDFKIVQVNLNLLDLRAMNYFDEWINKNVGVMARGPFASGLLSNANINFNNKADHRSRWPADLRIKLQDSKRDLLENLSINELDLKSISLRFVNSFAPIKSIVTSMVKTYELTENLKNLEKGSLDLKVMEKIISIIQSKTN